MSKSGGRWAHRLFVGSACQDPVPHIVPVLLALQAAKQGGKLCLINQPVVQCNGHIHLVKGVIDCAHQRAPLQQQPLLTNRQQQTHGCMLNAGFAAVLSLLQPLRWDMTLLAIH